MVEGIGNSKAHQLLVSEFKKPLTTSQSQWADQIPNKKRC
jgi:hypothetical protein